jgi:hypothetical protein
MTPEERRTKYARAFAEHDFERMGIDLALLTEDHPFWEIYLQTADVAIRLADEELHAAAEKQRAWAGDPMHEVQIGSDQLPFIVKATAGIVADLIDPKVTSVSAGDSPALTMAEIQRRQLMKLGQKVSANDESDRHSCTWPSCMPKEQQKALADEVLRQAAGKPPSPPMPEPSCGCRG